MTLNIAGFDVVLEQPILPEEKAASPYDPFNSSLKILSKGHRRNERTAQFTADAIFEKDIAVPMRDGVKLYCDIFRPIIDSKVPAIIVWSPYGKSGNGPHSLNMIEGRFGVPEEKLSGYEKFEGLDPAEWVPRGYAIINFDLRGSWDSEGILPWLGAQDGRDGYDAVEFVATLGWCNGKVAFCGNSWLAMSQWHIAAENPPHLAAIAPWEGACDFYRDTLCRGGVPYPYDKFWKVLESSMVGRGKIESVTEMLTRYPLYNKYWEDKRAKLHQITVPAYVLASYSTALHTSGSIRGFNGIGSKDRWLRIHAKQEWSDLYSQESTDDLQKFLDFYTKGIENDWQKTPRVRVSLLTFNSASIENVPFNSYPVPQTEYTKLYLTSVGCLDRNAVIQTGSTSYQADIIPEQTDNDTEESVFRYKFTKSTWLIGYSKAVLYLSCKELDDLDVFVQLRKLDTSGKMLQYLNVPLEQLVPPKKSASEIPNVCFLKYLGPTGVLRASHAGTKVEGSGTNTWPEYTHESSTPVKPGTICRLEIPIWPAGMSFEPGESLALKVAGHYMSMMEFEWLNGKSATQNKGDHTLYFGGDKDSHLVVPFIEPF